MRTAMLIHVPFFASLAFDFLELKIGKFPEVGVERAGTNGKTVWFDDDWLAQLNLQEAVFVYCHEIGHVMWMHMSRGKYYTDNGFDGQKFIPQLYNQAADYVINDMLVASGIGAMPKGGFYDPHRFPHTMNVDDVYRELLEDSGGGGSGGGEDGSESGGGGAGAGSGNEPREGPGRFDKHVYEPAQMNQAEVKRAIASAANQAKAMGKLPAALERFVNEVLTPQITWAERLRYLLSKALGRTNMDWTRPHRRRLVSQGIFFPAYTGHGAGTVVFAVDTSGSMGQAEYDAATAEAADILTQANPKELWMLSCDAKVHTTERLESGHDLYSAPVKMVGGGGTSFVPVFDWIDENLSCRPDVLIYFTDGYGTFPDREPDYPVVWVMTTDLEPPFGDALKVEV